MKHPEHMNKNTSQQWMWYRRKGVIDWILKGLVFIDTDHKGRYKDYQIQKAYELHVQENQLVVLRHPNCTKDDKSEQRFLSKLRKELQDIYSNLKDKY